MKTSTKQTKKDETSCKATVYDRSDGLCERCGMGGHTFHHRKNRSAGGLWEPSNVVHLCGDGTQLCHGWVTTHPMLAASEGYHVPSWQVVTSVPVRIHGHKWALLLPTGEYDWVVHTTDSNQEIV